MSAALKPKRLSSESEDEDRIQYIEVKASSAIKAILKAEKEAGKKDGKTIVQPSPLPTSTQTTHAAQQQKPAKPKFIKDDRHREYPRQKEQAKKQSPKNHSESNPQVKPNNKAKQESFKPQHEENQQQPRERKLYKEKDIPRESSPPSKQVKYVEKKEEKGAKKQSKYEGKKQDRNQFEIRKGEEVRVELLEDWELFQNEIYIGTQSAEQYLTIIRKLLKRYDFIVLKAYGQLVSKAFLIAGLLSQEFAPLEQINIPGTAKVRQFWQKEQKIRTRGQISIELSLVQLNKKHIGYQISEAPKHTEKKYAEKTQTNRRFKEREIDERELR